MKKGDIFSIVMLTVGTVLAALALDTILIPNTILDGGITGVSIIISKLTGIHLSILVATINIPFFYIGYKRLGSTFIKRTIYCMILFATFLKCFEVIEPLTSEMLLATVFGGAVLGIGVGLIMKFGGAIDGSESIAILINKKTGLSVGFIILCFNLIIYSVAGFIFGLDRALYSILTYFITYKMIDITMTSFEEEKAALIITEKGNHLTKEIYNKLGRTTTTIKGKGLISGDKEVLYCVLTRLEIFELKKIVSDMDESAFISIIDVSEIIGEHIKKKKKVKDV
ncbi:MAG: YitT family protein [Bacilli bacterium]|nr:YitT family protein [Bacilli bacterium]